MKVEIWSDVVCPFCYIGKRNFEKALAAFPAPEKVEVVWRSYQLDPTLKTTPGQSLHEYLAARKGFSTDHARQMGNYVTEAARQAGLTFPSTRRGRQYPTMHRLIHLAAARGLQDQAERTLFAAYLPKPRRGRPRTLVQLGTDIGLAAGVRATPASNAYADEVQTDQDEAAQVAPGRALLRVRGKIRLSGAQPSEVFAPCNKPGKKSRPNANDGLCTTDGCAVWYTIFMMIMIGLI
jgi:predicted DsbA family dithiol-disulfide isomerase